VQRIKSLEREQERAVTITTGGTTVRHFLRASVVRFRRRNPNVILNFAPANSTARCLEHLRAATADLAVVTVGQARRGIEQQVLAHQSLRLLVARATDWSRRKRVAIKDLAGMRYIGLSEWTSSSSHIEQALEEHAVTVQRVITVDDFDTACVFVELGLGQAIVPAVHAANFARSAQVASVAISGLAPLPIGLAARRFASLPAPANEFVQIFKQELNRMRRVPGLSVLGDG
jgi:DNA-binding transcriptional LysR family regulator